jgi:hypothetical protein
MSTVMLYDPTAAGATPPEAETATAATATKALIAGLAGKVVGFIDNAKPNFHILADELSELLVSRYGVARVVRYQKRAASVPAEKEVIARFADECDLVICGSGD